MTGELFPRMWFMKGEICVNGCKRFRIIVGLITVYLGFAAGLTYLIISYTLHAGYVKTEAVVVAVDRSGYENEVTYSYNADGETIEVTQRVRLLLNMHEGDRVKVRYDPEDPTELENRSAKTYVWIFTIMFGAGSVINTIVMIRRRR